MYLIWILHRLSAYLDIQHLVRTRGIDRDREDPVPVVQPGLVVVANVGLETRHVFRLIGRAFVCAIPPVLQVVVVPAQAVPLGQIATTHEIGRAHV